MSTYETPDAIAAFIDVGVARVVIVAGDLPRTRIEVAPSDPQRPADVALASDSRTEFGDGRLRVVVPRRNRVFGRTESVDVHVELPTGSAVDLRSRYGDVVVRGSLGRSRFEVSYGDTTIERTGDLHLQTPHGVVEVGTVDGDLDARTGHGRTRIGRVTGTTTLRGTHGDVEFGTVEGPLTAKLSGGLFVGRALASVEAGSAYGVVRVAELLGAGARMTTSYEGIEVGVPAGTAAWLDAESRHGTVRSELTSRDAPGDHDRSVELHLRSGHGDILVHRAVSGR
ncbi:hypothetical protein OG218_20590 [Kineococcus sp. NBC_00420]|uniref:DUF4097 family beta strand repeat-containing protein n=1 Tax=Kineococcus sp. NBC_00420 TaxID=2903564 RepID=UPI002E1ADA0F